jgi:predicted AAA+ superfamily ATPase
MATAARERLYTRILQRHLAAERQIAMVSGPRQVGKTTQCRTLADHYLNWDNLDDRRILLKGPAAVAVRLGLERLAAAPPVAVLDELHKDPRWKSRLKGFFDTYETRVRLVVTGSARLDIFRRGGDSLMGRYFLYRMHPWTVAECIDVAPPGEEIVRTPARLPDDDWRALWEHGGFPEPFLRRSPSFTRRWRRLRHELLMREDTRDIAQVADMGALEVLGQILAERSAQQLVYSNLSREVGTSVDTIRRWLDLLDRLYYGFRLRPWFENVPRSLRKEPKWYPRDWSGITDPGRRAETFVACHLLKAAEGWTDLGLGTFELRYLRDKEKREVDFVVVRDGRPWFLVEVKSTSERLSESLSRMQVRTGARHAFQCVLDSAFVDRDCFGETRPVIVPAKTLLSQLL